MQCACVQRLTLGGDWGREEHGQGRGEGSPRKGCHSCLQGEQECQVDAQQRPLGLVLTTCLVWKQAGQREEGMREHTGVRGLARFPPGVGTGAPSTTLHSRAQSKGIFSEPRMAEN